MNLQLPPKRKPVAHTDIETYNKRLQGSLEEKLWFVSRLPPEVTVFADFGCADGEVLASAGLRCLDPVRGRWPVLVGYDHDADMVEAAKQNPKLITSSWRKEFTSHPAMFAARLERRHKEGRKSCLILSSVIHEVLSQGTNWRTFWTYVQSLGCHYVAIRDMAVTQACRSGRLSPSLTIFEAMQNDLSLYRAFRAMGSISSRSDLIQVLLMARYPENIEREASEDYFALTSEQYLNLTTVGSGYKLRHYEHSGLPYLMDDWEKRYGITVTDPTHIKILLERR